MPIPTRKKVQTAVVCCLLAVSVVVLAGPARGDDSATEQARQHYETGSQQYDLGHWDDAIREYEKAYELRPDPSFLYNLAQAYRRKGDNKRALDLYRNYLAKTPKTPLRAEIEDRIKNLQNQIDEAASAKPIPSGQEPTVTQPGLARALLASPPGQSQTTVPGSPQTGAGPQASSATQPIVPPGSRAAVASDGPSGAPTVSEASPPPAPGRGLRIAGIATAAVGVVGVVAGAACGWKAHKLSNDVAGSSQFNRSDDSAGLRDQKLQWVFYGAGAGFIAAGAVLYYFGVRAARARPSSFSLSPVVGSGIAGVSAMGVF